VSTSQGLFLSLVKVDPDALQALLPENKEYRRNPMTCYLTQKEVGYISEIA
jgi:hypothetical protein